MATVEMSFTPLPAHVRTARLVATAVARRSGVAETLLDEVRLAVGEACSRAVEVHQEYCPDEPVRVALTGTPGRFEVVVTNSAGGAGGAVGPRGAGGAVGPGWTGPVGHAGPGQDGNAPRKGALPSANPRAGAPAPVGSGQGGAAPGSGPVVSRLPPAAPAELGLAVIAGLADDVEVSRTEGGLSIRMCWPSGETA